MRKMIPAALFLFVLSAGGAAAGAADFGIKGGINIANIHLGIEDAEKTDMKNESWMIMAGYAF